VRPDGTVVVPYLTPTTIEVVRSSDGGTSLGTPSVLSSVSYSDPPGLRAPPLPSAEIAADGRIFVAWPDCRFRAGCRPGADGVPNDIVLASSPDGVTWSSPARVPIGAATSGIGHVVPGLGVDVTSRGASTRLGLVSYTLLPRGCSPATCTLGAAFVSSGDAGRSWSAPLALGPRSGLASLADARGGRFVGDYVSTSFAARGMAVPVFSIATAPFDGRFHQFVFGARVPPQPARPSVAISGLRTTPARPRAGRPFAATAILRASGAPAGVRVVCRAAVGGKALRASSASLAGGRATCRWRIPAGTRGRRLTGSVGVVLAGSASRRGFSYRIA
jgi:hypothetical protein